eukprot:TRINITY_DN2714_c0_g1_i3.p1 TRINITY_DN2714_c0_g1~~TRINITY_DN2714_c0_g1_i3.p1  ORF type:complete len:386 (+),score=94.70 TRINITY_DN2714_c0_g1_i3:53-1210(+)
MHLSFSLFFAFNFFFFLMIRRPPRSTLSSSSAASDVYKRQGLAQFSHAAVVADQLSATQQRGPFFGGLTVGGPECDVPFECMSGWQLTTSTDDPKHSRVRQILHDAVEGLTVDPHAKRDLLLPPGLTDLDQADKDVLANIVGMNLWSRMFGLNQWSATLEALFTEYGAKGALCAVGIYKGDKLRVAEIVNEVGAAIEKTQVGQAILRMSTEGSTPLDPAKVINMVAFGFLFAGVGGSSHLTASSVARLRSDPALYVPMFKKNPQNFIVEQARIDPPVTSYNSLLQETVDATIMGKPMKLLKGTNKQNFIATANRDPAVFENGDIFNPDRANLDKVLSWNGPEDLVGLGKAPRGCPGHDIAQVVAKQVIRHFLPTQSKTGGSHAEL